MKENRQIDKWMNSQAAVNASLIDVSEPTRLDGLEAVIPAGVSAGLMLIATYGFAVTNDRLGWGGLASTAVFMITYFVTLAYGGTRFYIERNEPGEVAPTPADAFIRTARRNQAVRLPGKMRGLLVTFASYYNELGTMGINAWETSGHLNRADITAVRDYLVDSLEVASRDSRGVVEPSDWLLQQLPEWARRDFSGLVELASTSPTLEAA